MTELFWGPHFIILYKPTSHKIPITSSSCLLKTLDNAYNNLFYFQFHFKILSLQKKLINLNLCYKICKSLHPKGIKRRLIWVNNCDDLCHKYVKLQGATNR